MSKATQVFTCIFTNTPPQSGAYNVNTLPSQERAMFNAVSDAHGAIVAASGDQPLLLSVCYAKAPEFQAFLSGISLAPPFMAIMGTFPGGEKKYYLTKQPSQAKQYIEAMLSGEFGGTGLPTNAGDGDGGWGQGDGGLLCQLLPPVCALGFLPWLALSVFTTYKAAESRSATGRAVWGVPAFLFWQGFFARGGVKQIQWWVKKVGIGGIGKKSGVRLKLIDGYHATQTEKKAIAYMIEKGMKEGCTSANKCFEILSQSDDFVKVKVSTKGVWTIGDKAKWMYDTMTFELKVN